MNPNDLTISDVRRIAADSDADPRSVQRVLDGGRVRGLVDVRIRRALAAHGITPPEPTAEHAGV